MPTGFYKRTEKNTKTCFKKGFTPWNTGIKTPKIKHEKHPLWKGEGVSYEGLHQWVKRYLGTPKKCEMCGDKNKRQYHWANIDHKYRRVLNDYIRLCSSCHGKYDTEKGFRKHKSLEVNNVTK